MSNDWAFPVFYQYKISNMWRGTFLWVAGYRWGVGRRGTSSAVNSQSPVPTCTLQKAIFPFSLNWILCKLCTGCTLKNRKYLLGTSLPTLRFWQPRRKLFQKMQLSWTVKSSTQTSCPALSEKQDMWRRVSQESHKVMKNWESKTYTFSNVLQWDKRYLWLVLALK